MRKGIVFIFLLVVFSSLAVSQQNQSEQKPAPASPPPAVAPVPSEAAKIANPVKPTAESIAAGKKYYGYDCAMCHGESGDGKGEVAVAEGYNLKDFRDPETLKNKTDGEMFYILKKGHGKMPAEPVRVTENELWNLVNYVRSLAKK
jgi:mono/diheme cytochrome c family protein